MTGIRGVRGRSWELEAPLLVKQAMQSPYSRHLGQFLDVATLRHGKSERASETHWRTAPVYMSRKRPPIFCSSHPKIMKMLNPELRS